MDPARYETVRKLFAELLEQPDDARERRLRERAVDDPELVEQVRALLANHDEPAEILGSGDDEPALFEAAAVQLSAPEEIGGYQIVGEVGRGGMGIVYRARQRSPDRIVAVKVLRAGLVNDVMLRRFEQEVLVMGVLDHQGIARIYEAGSCDIGAGVQPYFAMELVDGVGLSAAAAELSVPDRCELVARIADAVQHAHERGIVHRDIKPENVLVTSEGQPKLLDFGIARDEQLRSGEMTMTGHGALLGTLAYMSPEQLETGVATPASDVYSLGVVLYELLAGRRPLEVRDSVLAQAMRTVQNTEPMRLRKWLPQVPVDLEIVVRVAMAKEAGQRYASMREFAADLRRVVRGEPIFARPQTSLYRLRRFAARNRPLAASLASLLVVLFAAVVLTSWLAALRDDEAELAARRGYAGNMLAASGRLHVDPFLTEMLLQNTSVELRGFEWDLMHASLDRGERLFELDERTVRSCLYDANGRALVALANGREVTVLDFATREVLRRYRAPTDVRELFFSASADRLGLVCDVRDQAFDRLIVLPVAGGDPLFDHADADLRTDDLDFSPDGRTLLPRWRTKQQGLVRIDVEAGAWRELIAPGPNDHATILPGSRTFAFYRKVYDLGTGDHVGAMPFKGIVRPSPSGGLLAGSHPDHRHLYLADSVDDEPRKLLSHRERLTAVQWSRDGEVLMSASYPAGSITVCDPRKQIVISSVHAEFDRDPQLHPDGDSILISTRRGVEEMPAVRSARVLGPHEDYLMGVAFSPDGGLLACCDTKGRTSIWDVDSATRLYVSGDLGKTRRVNNQPEGVAWSADGLRLYAVIAWMRAVRFDLATGESQILPGDVLSPENEDSVWRDIDEGMRMCRSWVSSRDGRFVVAQAEPSKASRWSSLPSTLFERSSDGESWVARSGSERWSGEARRRFQRTGLAERVARRRVSERSEHDICVAFDTERERMATGHGNGMVVIWSLATGEVIRSIDAHIGSATALAWTADGRLISGGVDGSLRIWDAELGIRLAVFDEHRNTIECIAISPDGTRFATASEDRTVRLWDTRPVWQRRRDAERVRAAEAEVRERVAAELADGDRTAALRAIWSDERLTLEQRQAARLLLLRR